jgi:UDP-glucose 4-epimerase
MNVIVTGGSGKGGSVTVAELIRAGHVVTNVDLVPPAEPQEARFLQVDLSDAGEVYDAFAQVRPEGVCHIAANPQPHGFAQHKTFANNVMSSYNVMQAAGDLGARRLVYASSVMACGWGGSGELPHRFPITVEDRLPSPNSYAMSKFIGEVIADGMVRRYPRLSIASL